MWDAGKPKNYKLLDTNDEFLKLEGELTDEMAMATLAEFLYANPGLALELLAGLRLYPIQELIIRGWCRNDYSMAVWGRGLSKSFSCAVFCLFWALFNPNARIVIISFAFRASRRILEQIEKFVNDEDAKLLKNCFPKDMSKRGDEWKWTLPNGASILCVPLGDGTKLRGIRAEVVVVDERNYVSAQVLNEVIQPFLVSNNNIKEQLRTKEREDAEIEAGRLKESDRTIFRSDIKVIYLSSAGYQFEDMYKQYLKWIENIQGIRQLNDDEEDLDINANYFVSRLSFEAAPEGMVNAKTIAEAQNGQTSESVFDREYRAIFTKDSGGFFSAKKMMDCTVPNGEAPCIELVGEKGAEYVLSIDPSFSSAEYSDYFAMVVEKSVRKGDRTIPMVVHNYMVAGGDMKEHHLYLLYILKNFNIVYIAIDSSQGDNEFITSANNSKLFKDAGIELMELDADFKIEDTSALPKQVRQSYNKTAYRIVQKQPFSSHFQKSANEQLQITFDFGRIVFAGKLAAHPVEGEKATECDISAIKAGHSFYKDMSIQEFIEHQDNLMDLLKQQCAMIELSSSSLGSQSWDLPINFRRSKNPERLRKDGYSALLLGNYAFRIYQDAMNYNLEDSSGDFLARMV